MTRRDIVLLLCCGLALAAAAVFLVRHLKNRDTGESKVFFYDLSERKLFTAPATAVPPIRGLNDAAEDAMRAVVISTNGKPKDKQSWKVAYIEKCSPELKQQFEDAQRSGTSPPIGRAMAQGHRFVRRLTDVDWVAMNSAEATIILNEWLTAGPDGGPAVICTP